MGFSGSAWAGDVTPAVLELVWTASSNGEAQLGGDTIDAEVGDTITVELRMTGGSEGVANFGISVMWNMNADELANTVWTINPDLTTGDPFNVPLSGGELQIDVPELWTVATSCFFCASGGLQDGESIVIGQLTFEVTDQVGDNGPDINFFERPGFDGITSIGSGGEAALSEFLPATVTPAGAPTDPFLEMVWVDSTNVDAVLGGAGIDADPGDTVTVQMSITAGTAGIGNFGISAAWNMGVSLPELVNPVWTGPSDLPTIDPFDVVLSNGTLEVQTSTLGTASVACFDFPPPCMGLFEDESFVFGELEFDVTNDVMTDGDDIIFVDRRGFDGLTDNNATPIPDFDLFGAAVNGIPVSTGNMPEFRFEWTTCLRLGADCPGDPISPDGTEIDAEPGDIIVMDVFGVAGAQGIRNMSISLEWNLDNQELINPEWTSAVPTDPPFETLINEGTLDDVASQVQSIAQSACDECLPLLDGEETFLGTLRFTVTTDLDEIDDTGESEIFFALLPAPAPARGAGGDAILDAFNLPIAPQDMVFGTATVSVVPEPALALLQLAALGALVAVRRRRKA